MCGGVLYNNCIVVQDPVNVAPVTWDAKKKIFFSEKNLEGIETGNPVPTRLVQRYACCVVKVWAYVRCPILSPHGHQVHIAPPHGSPLKGYITE